MCLDRPRYLPSQLGNTFSQLILLTHCTIMDYLLTQLWRNRIAQARKPSGSQRSSRAGTPTAFGQQPAQQSMPSFQPPGQSGTGFGGDFSFSVNAPSNPFAQMNGAASTPPPTNFQFGGGPEQTLQNGGGSIFGNNNPSFGSTFDSTTSQQPELCQAEQR